MGWLLDDDMSRSRDPSRANSEKQREATTVKTFLVEALLPETYGIDSTASYLEQTLPKATHKRIVNLEMKRAKSDPVVSVRATVRDEPVQAYIDFTNPRFWFLHSTSESDALEMLVSTWVNDLPELDRAWFPSGLLDRYSELGTLRGIGLEYSNSWLKKHDPEASDAFKMQLRSRAAQRVLRTMRSPSGEPHAARLSKVVIDAKGIISDIKYDGKVAGRGKSFYDHLAITNDVYELYMEQVRHVEREYAIGGRCEGGGASLSGGPITFKFSPDIDDLSRFAEAMFSGAAPFNLWGVPTKINDGFYRVHALDLHSSRTLSFELTKSYIRVYLPEGSCGNSILRILTTLQARYDAQVEAVNGDGEPVFGF